LPDLPNLPAGNEEIFLLAVRTIWFVFLCELFSWVHGWMLQGRGEKIYL
jgi:hypothetical protein